MRAQTFAWPSFKVKEKKDYKTKSRRIWLNVAFVKAAKVFEITADFQTHLSKGHYANAKNVNVESTDFHSVWMKNFQKSKKKKFGREKF